MRPSQDKQNLFQENEKKSEPFGLTPIRAPVDDLFARKDSGKQENSKRIGLLEDLEEKKNDNHWNKVENKPFLIEDNEKKNNLFRGIKVSDNKKRNWGYLFKENEKKDDKIAALYTSAVTHNFFGGFNDNFDSK